MAAPFDINHDMLHELAGVLGMGGLPIAAMLISVNLVRRSAWGSAKRCLLWTANLTWVSVVLLAVTCVLMAVTFSQTPGGLPSHPPKVLPAGVIGLFGWTNRLQVFLYCTLAITVAGRAMKQAGTFRK